MSKPTEQNLETRFKTTLAKELLTTLGLANPLSVPSLKKIVVNIGITKSDSSEKDLATAKAELTSITGQVPRVAGAKKSIAGFKIREGDSVGLSVTLRGSRMFDFLDKLCRIVLPQVKDFRGVKLGAFDGHGNYTLGLAEQIIFPEIDYAKVEKIRGLEITIVTSAKDDVTAKALLVALGMPFEKENN